MRDLQEIAHHTQDRVICKEEIWNRPGFPGKSEARNWQSVDVDHRRNNECGSTGLMLKTNEEHSWNDLVRSWLETILFRMQILFLWRLCKEYGTNLYPLGTRFEAQGDWSISTRYVGLLDKQLSNKGQTSIPLRFRVATTCDTSSVTYDVRRCE